MIQIIPAILDKTPEDFKSHIEQLKNSHAFREGWIHIDFADNEFVPNQTIGVEEVGKIDINLKKEAHLMVNNPLQWVEKLKNAGFERVVFHFECKDEVNQVIDAVKGAGMEVGIAINSTTALQALEPFQDRLDQILVMGIIPGFQGQPFIPDTIDRIKELKAKGLPVKISVDGSVRDSNARGLVQAGVDQLVIGSFLLKGDLDENVEKIWEAISGS